MHVSLRSDVNDREDALSAHIRLRLLRSDGEVGQPILLEWQKEGAKRSRSTHEARHEHLRFQRPYKSGGKPYVRKGNEGEMAESRHLW